MLTLFSSRRNHLQTLTLHWRYDSHRLQLQQPQAWAWWVAWWWWQNWIFKTGYFEWEFHIIFVIQTKMQCLNINLISVLDPSFVCGLEISSKDVLQNESAKHVVLCVLLIQNKLWNCSGVASGGSAAVGAVGGGGLPSNSLIPTLSLSLALIAATALVPVAVFPPFAT